MARTKKARSRKFRQSKNPSEEGEQGMFAKTKLKSWKTVSKRKADKSKKVVPIGGDSDRSEYWAVAYEVLESDPEILTEEQVDALIGYIRLKDTYTLQANFDVGHCAEVLYRATPKKSVPELKQKFEKLSLDYQAAMSLRHLYRTYKDDSTELIQYRGPTVAKLLCRYKTRRKREEIWEKYNSLERLREYLKTLKAKEKGNAKVARVDPKALQVGSSWTEIRAGQKAKYVKGVLVVRLSGEGKTAQEFEVIISKFLGRSVHLVRTTK